MDMKRDNSESAARDGESAALVPPVDIVEDADGITLTADLPGVGKENLSVGIDGDTLTINGAVSLGEAKTLQSVYAEVRVAEYRRTFILSRDLDSQRIDASMKDGVLTLRVPKAEKAKPRRVEVKAA
jgi:HSP20 family molecular chaperone IbpA